VIDKLPAAKSFLNALYSCHYSEVFPAFLGVVDELQSDLFLADHVKFYMHEARVVVYLQFLTSYKSVTISAMAKAFGVSEAFIDTEVRVSAQVLQHKHTVCMCDCSV
jgi:26S proteasome regulatory subunit N7